MSYRNPILPGFNPDPSICRVGNDYFIATSTFQFFPGVPIYHSTDLVNWTLIGHALNRRTQLDMRTVEGGGGIFAPTLRYWKGRWYMTTCAAYRIRFGTKDVSRMILLRRVGTDLCDCSRSLRPEVSTSRPTTFLTRRNGASLCSLTC